MKKTFSLLTLLLLATCLVWLAGSTVAETTYGPAEAIESATSNLIPANESPPGVVGTITIATFADAADKLTWETLGDAVGDTIADLLSGTTADLPHIEKEVEAAVLTGEQGEIQALKKSVKLDAEAEYVVYLLKSGELLVMTGAENIQVNDSSPPAAATMMPKHVFAAGSIDKFTPDACVAQKGTDEVDGKLAVEASRRLFGSDPSPNLTADDTVRKKASAIIEGSLCMISEPELKLDTAVVDAEALI